MIVFMLYQTFFILSQKNKAKFIRSGFLLIQIMYITLIIIVAVTTFMISSVHMYLKKNSHTEFPVVILTYISTFSELKFNTVF